MSIPIKKIYVDTKKKTQDSFSNSRFKWELPETISLPHNTIFYIDDICIPHSWYTIESNMNDRLYVQVSDNNANYLLRGNNCQIVMLTAGHYNLQTLAAEINSKMNAAFYTNQIPAHFSTTANHINNTITITPQDASLLVKILTDTDLVTGMADVNLYGWGGAWNGTAYNTSQPNDINDIIGNAEGSSSFFSQASPFSTGYIDLQPIKNIYMYSPNLGTFKTYGPMGEVTIVKKIPVNAGDNMMIFDNVSSSSDYLDCSRQTLKTIQFELKDVHGTLIPLHGAHVSFSLVFDKYRENE